MSFETSLEQWREGERRLAEAPAYEQDALERVVRRITAELRRRLGGAFTAEELSDLYERQGTGWCIDLAIAPRPTIRTPGTPASSPTPPSPATCAARSTSPAGAAAWSEPPPRAAARPRAVTACA